MRPRHLVLALTLLGCGTSASIPQPSTAHETPPGLPVPASAGVQPALPTFDVHEWGLIDVYTDGQIELAAGPGSAASRPTPAHPLDRPSTPMRKPVLYFHLDPAADPLEFNVDVRIAGAFIETWPTPTTRPTAAHITWQGTLQHCTAGGSRAADDATLIAARAHCTSSDQVCEVIDLPTYETNDADCVRIGAQEGRLLFYRGELAQGTTFPLSVAMNAPPGQPVISALPTLTVSAPLDHPVFFVSGGAGSIHHVQVGEPTTLPASTGPAQPHLPRADSLIEPFAAELIRAGLTEDEARAFMAAWSASLFGAERDVRRHVGPARSTLLYFLPRADIERLAPMQITPTPRRLERVMVVRHHIAR